MAENTPMKKSEILAIENIKRIADQLRAERNDAWAIAQVQRERADNLAVLLREARELLVASRNVLEKHHGLKVADLVARLDRALNN